MVDDKIFICVLLPIEHDLESSPRWTIYHIEMYFFLNVFFIIGHVVKYLLHEILYKN